MLAIISARRAPYFFIAPFDTQTRDNRAWESNAIDRTEDRRGVQNREVCTDRRAAMPIEVARTSGAGGGTTSPP